MFHSDLIDSFLAQWVIVSGSPSSWQHPCHFFDDTAETVRWIFVLDILNHCFWPDVGETTWTIQYQGESYSGYWGLAGSLKRAMESGVPITDAEFIANLAIEDLREIFSGEGEMPMLGERLRNLREAGRVLQSRWSGDIVKLVEGSRASAVKLASEIVSSFPSFRDEAIYHGKKVYFWKRAQIFVSDLCHAFAGERWGCFHDIQELTAFADYKLPQVLRALGLISYSAELAEKIDSRKKLKSGCEEEIEIRAITILAVEELKEGFMHLGTEATSAEIDNRLWQLGQLEPFRKKPYHRCRTIFY
ncbi:MAG: queuosine salvage family protein [Syntrophobacteraceae bacterium]